MEVCHLYKQAIGLILFKTMIYRMPVTLLIKAIVVSMRIVPYNYYYFSILFIMHD